MIKNTDSLSVSSLTNKIRAALESDFININVQGEISNFKFHSSGHSYFSLKDDKAQIKCVLWRGRTLNFKPQDGMKVIARGSITVYPPQGNYQLDCTELSQLGQGDLYLAYELLKQKFAKEGYFSPERKKSIPKIPLNIGVSTSPTGAAIQDILSTLRRRLPFTNVFFRPTLVQGEGSANDIVNAINELGKTKSEVIIVGRGGGSIEDLWSYNTQEVAEAIFNSKIPIVSAIGHETDFTIADFVSDLRAPTPTAAAELVSSINIDDISSFLESSINQLNRNINSKIDELKSGVIEKFNIYAKRRIIEKFGRYSQYIDNAELTIGNYIKSNFSNSKEIINRLDSHLKSLHPFAPFDKGFAALKNNGKYLSNDISLKDLDSVEIIRKFENINVNLNTEKK